MTSDKDENLDPSDWLASQFSAPEPEKPAPDAAPPAAPPAMPVLPLPTPQTPPVAAAPTEGAPFQWGLTPGTPVAPTPAPDPFPVAPTPAPDPFPVAPTPAAEPFAFPPPPAEPVAPPAFDPFATQAMPVTPPADPTPPAAFSYPTVPIEPNPGAWFAAPVDYSFDGTTDVVEAELVGLGTPTDEGVAASPLDALFGDTQFRDYGDEPIIPPPPPRSPGTMVRVAPKGPRAPIPRTQKILIGVAIGLVAALALIALFGLGTRLSSVLGTPAALATPTPTPSASFIVLPVGPVAPGEYQWDELLGGECLQPWESAWEDRYTVVDCAVPHPAQMVFRGTFDDEAVAAYPGVEALQARINLLCTAPTIIDYAKAGAANDIQVSASFAADATDWDDGNRTFFCFVNRSGGGDFTESIAIQQVPVTPTPTPAAG